MLSKKGLFQDWLFEKNNKKNVFFAPDDEIVVYRLSWFITTPLIKRAPRNNYNKHTFKFYIFLMFEKKLLRQKNGSKKSAAKCNFIDQIGSKIARASSNWLKKCRLRKSSK